MAGDDEAGSKRGLLAGPVDLGGQDRGVDLAVAVVVGKPLGHRPVEASGEPLGVCFGGAPSDHPECNHDQAQKGKGDSGTGAVWKTYKHGACPAARNREFVSPADLHEKTLQGAGLGRGQAAKPRLSYRLAIVRDCPPQLPPAARRDGDPHTAAIGGIALAPDEAGIGDPVSEACQRTGGGTPSWAARSNI